MRALYVSPIDVTVNNGMRQRQAQTMAVLADLYPGQCDVLSLGSSPGAMRRWLAGAGVKCHVVDGVWAWIAFANATAWYGGGVVLCNKLRLTRHFRFPIRTPLPLAWFQRYATIVCYYPWAYHLLCLNRGGRRVVVDLGDVMGERHCRIGKRRWISLASDDERAILHSDSRGVAISESDAVEFARLYGRDLPVLPFCPPNAERLVELGDVARPRRVGYLAAPSYLNEAIIELLASSAFLEPLRAAGIELVVAGGICATADPRHLAAMRTGGARVLGPVQDIEGFYREVAVVLNPVGPSTGIKIKSVEALLAGCGLITTRWGIDATLQRLFSNQIRLLDWPTTPTAVAQATVDLVALTARPESGSAARYLEQARAAMRAALSP